MKVLMFFLVLLTSVAYANDNQENSDDLYPYCMNIPHSSDVLICMIDVASRKEKEYKETFNLYLKSVTAPGERSYDQSHIARLVEKARKNWDAYMKDECLAEASVYEKDSYGYNAAYNICLTIRYDSRIKYYRSKTH